MKKRRGMGEGHGGVVQSKKGLPTGGLRLAARAGPQASRSTVGLPCLGGRAVRGASGGGRIKRGHASCEGLYKALKGVPR